MKRSQYVKLDYYETVKDLSYTKSDVSSKKVRKNIEAVQWQVIRKWKESKGE